MRTVLLSHPYHLALDPREAQLGRPYPPLSTLVAGAVARRAGHEVVLHDPMFEADETGFGPALDRAIARHGVDGVAILADDHSVQVKQCLARVRQAHQAMAAAARERGLDVLVAGPDVSDRPEEYLASGATAAAVGDAAEILAEWLDGRSGIRGLHGAGGGGGRRSVIGDLSRLPPPAWDLADLSEYARRWRSRRGHWELNIWTARGCPYRCNWCAKPTWGRSYHVRPVAQVLDEMRLLADTVAPDRIWFTDDIFALRRDWLQEFREAVETRLERPLPYRCLSRADLLRDADYVADLAASGCDEVWIGAESGSDRILRAMDKDATVADVRRSTRLLHRHGIRIGFFLQLGYPGETYEEVLETVKMVRRLQPDAIGVSVSYPLPGTAFHERVRGSMQASSWRQSMENRTLFEAPFGEDFYAAAREVLRSTWSASRAASALREMLRHPGPREARRLAGAAFHAARLPIVRRRMRRLAIHNPQAVALTW